MREITERDQETLDRQIAAHLDRHFRPLATRREIAVMVALHYRQAGEMTTAEVKDFLAQRAA